MKTQSSKNIESNSDITKRSPSMSEHGTLGSLTKLPWEIRELVYEYLTYRPAFSSSEEVTDFDESFPRSLRENNLAILRTSRSVYMDVTCLLYNQWHLTFKVSPQLYIRNVRTSLGLFPKIEVQVTHRRQGIRFLPLLTGLEYYNRAWSGRQFRNIPYHRFASVTIEMLSPDQSNPGTLFISWRASKLLAWVFQTLPPGHLTIRARGKWDNKRTFLLHHPDTTSELSTLEILLCPFQYLVNTQITMTPNFFPMPQASKLCDHPQNGIREMQISVCQQSGEGDTVTDSFDRLGHRDHFQLADLWFDSALDETPGELAAHLRLQRWMLWDLPYERHILMSGFHLKSDKRQQFFVDFAERWAVRRAMDYRSRDADFDDWNEKLRDPDPLQSSQAFYNERCRNKPYSWRHPLERYKTPRKDDTNWRKLRSCGLFYRRRILLTTNGVLWDPQHTTKTKHKPYIAELRDVLFVHEPSSLPQRKTQKLPADRRFAAASDILPQRSLYEV